MKILIAYVSKSGTTKKCAGMLAEKLPTHNVTIANLEKENPDISGYDFVAVGGPVRYGKLCGEMAQYISRNAEELKKIRAGYFITCGYVDSGDEYIHKLISPDLIERADAAACFGGELILKNLKGWDRFVARIIVSYVLDDGKRDGEEKVRSLPEIMPDSISRFADAIAERF